jgi:hypothetical protein
VAYWLATVALIVLGVLTGFSIGPFILLVAAAMVVLGPVRHRPAIYWPPMAAVFAFLIGFVGVAPMSCAATAVIPGEVSTTVCSSLFGLRYTGTGIYNPSLLPGVYAGLALAGIALLLVAGAMWWRRRVRPRDDAP